MASVQAIQTFYQENLGLIYRFVYSNIGNREEAEDITSDIFLKAVRGVDTERGPLSMQKWVFQSLILRWPTAGGRIIENVGQPVRWMSRSEAGAKIVQFRALKRAADLEQGVRGTMESDLVVS